MAYINIKEAICLDSEYNISGNGGGFIMLTKREVLDLAVECGLDEEKFLALLRKKEDFSEELLQDELDNVSGGTGGTIHPADTQVVQNKKC